MKKLLIMLVCFPFLFGCSDGDEILGGCYVSPNLDITCTEEYNPVCACNNLVYSNACEAEKAGNLNYKLTDKDSGEQCSY